MADSKIEEVARAIDPKAFSQFESLRDFCLRSGDEEAEALKTAEWAHGHDVRQAIEKARAAIEAMREPTLEMINAGEGNVSAPEDVRYVFAAMIDAALNEEVAG